MDEAELLGRVQSMVDDLEIRRVMHEYATRIDLRDWQNLRPLFADDLVVDYHNGRTIVRGGDDVVAYIRANTAHLAWQHHHVTPYAVNVDGDRASAHTYLISHQVIAEDPTHVLMMAATYDCEFQRAARGWLLKHMVHRIKLLNFLPVTSQAPVAVEIPEAVAP